MRTMVRLHNLTSEEEYLKGSRDTGQPPPQQPQQPSPLQPPSQVQCSATNEINVRDFAPTDRRLIACAVVRDLGSLQHQLATLAGGFPQSFYLSMIGIMGFQMLCRLLASLRVNGEQRHRCLRGDSSRYRLAIPTARGRIPAARRAGSARIGGRRVRQQPTLLTVICKISFLSWRRVRLRHPCSAIALFLVGYFAFASAAHSFAVPSVVALISSVHTSLRRRWWETPLRRSRLSFLLVFFGRTPRPRARCGPPPGPLGSLLRGGAAGADTTERQRQDQSLLKSLQQLLANHVSPASTSAAPAHPQGKQPNRWNKRKQIRLQAKEEGLIGELSKIVQRSSSASKSDAQVLDALRSLVARHTQGNSSGVSEPAPAAPAASNKQPQGSGKGRGEGKKSVDELVKLDPVHWEGNAVQPSGLSAAIATATADTSIICGIANHRPTELDGLADRVSVALVSTKPLCIDSEEIRAPARSKAGILKITKLFLTKAGPRTTWLKWGPQKTTVKIDAPPESEVVRVQIFKAYLAASEWESLRTKRGVAPAFRHAVAKVISWSRLHGCLSPPGSIRRCGPGVHLRTHQSPKGQAG